MRRLIHLYRRFFDWLMAPGTCPSCGRKPMEGGGCEECQAWQRNAP